MHTRSPQQIAGDLDPLGSVACHGPLGPGRVSQSWECGSRQPSRVVLNGRAAKAGRMRYAPTPPRTGQRSSMPRFYRTGLHSHTPLRRVVRFGHADNSRTVKAAGVALDIGDGRGVGVADRDTTRGRLVSWRSPSSFVRLLTTVVAGKPSAEWFSWLPPRRLAPSRRVLALLKRLAVSNQLPAFSWD